MKLKKSIIIAITSMLNTAIISILSLIFTNIILKNYGSDYNGIVATVMQIMTVLLVLEGGITYASNYAMYKPYLENDYDKINIILSKTKKQFTKAGVLIFLVGLVISIIYPFIVKSNLDYFTIFFIIFFVVVSTSFNIYFTTKMNVLFQASQKEYLLTCINLIVNIVVYSLIILLANVQTNILIIRLIVMLGVFCVGILTYFMFNKIFPYAKFTNTNVDIEIAGSKDIIIQRITGIMYSSFPMIFISSAVGTIYTSVYSVYNSIFNIIKTLLYSIISAPSNGFGQLFASSEKKIVYEKFKTYNYLTIFSLTCLISSVLSVIIPFVRLYTRNVNDINYTSELLSILFAINLYFEIIHTPSGTIISVSGNFKAGKRIQLMAMLILFPLLIIGSITFKLYGIMVALVITSMALAVMEIYYTYKKIFDESLIYMTCVCILNLILIIALFYFWKIFNIQFGSYFQFLIDGFLIFLCDSFIILLVNIIFFRRSVLDVINNFKCLINKDKIK